MEAKHQNNKHLGIMIFIGFLLIVIGVISYVIINYNNDQAEVKKRMHVVREYYEEFKTDVESFNKIRDNIYSEVLSDTYYQTLKDNDANYKEKMFVDGNNNITYGFSDSDYTVTYFETNSKFTKFKSIF